MVAKTQPIPNDGPDTALQKMLPLLPQAERGVEPYPRALRRRNREESALAS